MKKHVLVLLALAMVGLVGFYHRGEAQEPAAKTLSIATLAPPGSTWMRVFDSWNREVRRRSNRTLQFRFYAGGVQGDESEVIRKIRSGRLDGAAVTAVGLAQVYRPALVFQLPGILNNYTQLDNARTALGADMDAGFDGAGFKMLGWADVGQSRIFSNSAIRTPADFANKKPWVWRDDLVLPGFFQVVRSHPVSLQVPEVLGALQTNRIDTLIATPVSMVALQWSSRVTHMTDLPLTIVVGGTVMGKRQFEALTAEQKAIITETANQFHALARRNLRRDETEALSTLAQRNIQVVPVTEAQKAEWRRTADQVRTRLQGQVADAALVTRVSGFGR